MSGPESRTSDYGQSQGSGDWRWGSNNEFAFLPLAGGFLKI